MKQFMDSSISDSVLESARLDGCSEFKTFWVIAMPMVKPAWLTLIIYSFQGLWNTGASAYIYSEQWKTDWFVDIIMARTEKLAGKKVDVGITNFRGLKSQDPLIVF